MFTRPTGEFEYHSSGGEHIGQHIPDRQPVALRRWKEQPPVWTDGLHGVHSLQLLAAVLQERVSS